jgi:hypothetical protein
VGVWVYECSEPQFYEVVQVLSVYDNVGVVNLQQKMFFCSFYLLILEIATASSLLNTGTALDLCIVAMPMTFVPV